MNPNWWLTKFRVTANFGPLHKSESLLLSLESSPVQSPTTATASFSAPAGYNQSTVQFTPPEEENATVDELVEC